jgi:hypothetical protein
VVFFIVLMGVYPRMFFKKMDTSVEGLLKFVKERNAYYQTMEGVAAHGPASRLLSAAGAGLDQAGGH